MTDGRTSTTIFVENGSETIVRTTFDAESENPVELQQQRWQLIFDNVKKYMKVKDENQNQIYKKFRKVCENKLKYSILKLFILVYSHSLFSINLKNNLI
jgi:hypothetical protein